MKNKKASAFIDPICIPWVGGGLLVLLFLLLPIWPVKGNWWGIPAWSALALFASFLTSIFIAYVILFVWQDPDESSEGEPDD